MLTNTTSLCSFIMYWTGVIRFSCMSTLNLIMLNIFNPPRVTKFSMCMYYWRKLSWLVDFLLKCCPTYEWPNHQFCKFVLVSPCVWSSSYTHQALRQEWSMFCTATDRRKSRLKCMRIIIWIEHNHTWLQYKWPGSVALLVGLQYVTSFWPVTVCPSYAYKNG